MRRRPGEPPLFGRYPWNTRVPGCHRHQIRQEYGIHAAIEDEEDQRARWLADQVRPVGIDRTELAQAVVNRCRTPKAEPPRPGQSERIVASAGRRFEEALAGQEAR
ncbi:DUF4158 domain-containing protein [Nocardiopsis alborubida]|uniref:DUF4158 domain-containing protein n=1 Tax=Nocardiopsis alborubida TaxID=146802 RepID=UPI00076E3498|nr:DUF4158 domain-containing protein [Nocardiopsis alborubida]